MGTATLKQFSIGGTVGIAIGFIGLGLQWTYPEQGWIGKWVAIVGFAVLGIAVVAYITRWLTIREYQRNHAIPGAIFPARDSITSRTPVFPVCRKA
jgi:hypothetical protein